MDDIIPSESWEHQYYEAYWPLHGADGVIACGNSLEDVESQARDFIKEHKDGVCQTILEAKEYKEAKWWYEDLRRRVLIITEHRSQSINDWSLEAQRLVKRLGVNARLEVEEVDDA